MVQRPSIPVPQPRTIDRDKMTGEQLLAEAKMLAKTWRFQEALASYEQALQRDPGWLDALFGKGEMLRRLSRTKEQVAVYDDILTRDPTSTEAFLKKAWAFVSLKRYEEALALFDHVQGQQERNGTSREFKDLLWDRFPDIFAKWYKSPSKYVDELKKIAPELREEGIDATFPPETALITLTRPGKENVDRTSRDSRSPLALFVGMNINSTFDYQTT